jgi:hypothetical protein
MYNLVRQFLKASLELQSDHFKWMKFRTAPFYNNDRLYITNFCLTNLLNVCYISKHYTLNITAKALPQMLSLMIFQAHFKYSQNIMWKKFIKQKRRKETEWFKSFYIRFPATSSNRPRILNELWFRFLSQIKTTKYFAYCYY